MDIVTITRWSRSFRQGYEPYLLWGYMWMYVDAGAFNYQSPASLDVPVADEKYWWPQSEALITSIKLRRVLRDRSFDDMFVTVLGFIENHLVNWEYGEWHRSIINGQITGLKADSGKGEALRSCRQSDTTTTTRIL